MYPFIFGVVGQATIKTGDIVVSGHETIVPDSLVVHMHAHVASSYCLGYYASEKAIFCLRMPRDISSPLQFRSVYESKHIILSFTAVVHNTADVLVVVSRADGGVRVREHVDVVHPDWNAIYMALYSEQVIPLDTTVTASNFILDDVYREGLLQIASAGADIFTLQMTIDTLTVARFAWPEGTSFVAQKDLLSVESVLTLDAGRARVLSALRVDVDGSRVFVLCPVQQNGDHHMYMGILDGELKVLGGDLSKSRPVFTTTTVGYVSTAWADTTSVFVGFDGFVWRVQTTSSAGLDVTELRYSFLADSHFIRLGAAYITMPYIPSRRHEADTEDVDAVCAIGFHHLDHMTGYYHLVSINSTLATCASQCKSIVLCIGYNIQGALCSHVYASNVIMTPPLDSLDISIDVCRRNTRDARVVRRARHTTSSVPAHSCRTRAVLADMLGWSLGDAAPAGYFVLPAEGLVVISETEQTSYQRWPYQLQDFPYTTVAAVSEIGNSVITSAFYYWTGTRSDWCYGCQMGVVDLKLDAGIAYVVEKETWDRRGSNKRSGLKILDGNQLLSVWYYNDNGFVVVYCQGGLVIDAYQYDTQKQIHHRTMSGTKLEISNGAQVVRIIHTEAPLSYQQVFVLLQPQTLSSSQEPVFAPVLPDTWTYAHTYADIVVPGAAFDVVLRRAEADDAAFEEKRTVAVDALTLVPVLSLGSFDARCSDTACGGGRLNGGEQCDDGNTADYDGCSGSCTIEAGWDCPAAWCTRSECSHQRVCGDGRRADTEACDDGDVVGGDGCSAACTVEHGWTCQLSEPPWWDSSPADASPDECLCAPGFADISAGCVQCEAGEFAEQGDPFCRGCGAGTDSEDIAGVRECFCKAGYAGNDTNSCVSCPGAAPFITRDAANMTTAVDWDRACCGDGMKTDNEGCDDAEAASAGCSDTCTVECGYTCHDVEQGTRPFRSACIKTPRLRLYTVNINAGTHYLEESVKIHDSQGTEIFSRSVGAEVPAVVNLTEGATYTITPHDTFGDGWTGNDDDDISSVSVTYTIEGVTTTAMSINMDADNNEFVDGFIGDSKTFAIPETRLCGDGYILASVGCECLVDQSSRRRLLSVAAGDTSSADPTSAPSSRHFISAEVSDIPSTDPTSAPSSRRFISAEVSDIPSTDPTSAPSGRRLLSVAAPVYEGISLVLPMYVPTLPELQEIGLDACMHGEDTEGWQRLHVTATMEWDGPQTCSYDVGVVGLGSTRAIAEHNGELHRLGCRIEAAGERYAVCHLEVPTGLQDTATWKAPSVGLVAHGGDCVEPRHFTVVIEPFTTLFACPDEGEFWDYRLGECVGCELTGDHAGECAAGKYRKGCDALVHISDNTGQCKSCPQTIDSSTEDFSDDAACEVVCKPGAFFRANASVSCRACTALAPPGSCDPGQMPQACTRVRDWHCGACPAIRKGQFSANEHYVRRADTDCHTECNNGAYSSVEDETEFCKPCADRQHLLEFASLRFPGSFLEFVACTESANTFTRPCPWRNLSSVTGHAPAIGAECVYTCDRGAHPLNATATQKAQCVACDAMHDYDGSVLPARAYTVTSLACDVECRAPWHAYNHTCWNCSKHRCGTGTFLHNCSECLNCSSPGPHWVLTGPGAWRADACPAECEHGYWQDFNLCSPHTALGTVRSACLPGEYISPPTQLSDRLCLRCRSCEGLNQTRNCSLEHNRECAACPVPTLDEHFGARCEERCRPGRVSFFGGPCEACSVQCLAGTLLTANSTHCSDCRPCPEPLPLNGTWFLGCAFRVRSGVLESESAPAPAAPTLLRCGPLEFHDGAACLPCGQYPDPSRPPPHQLDYSWVWTPGAGACTWQCLPGLTAFQEAGLATMCAAFASVQTTLAAANTDVVSGSMATTFRPKAHTHKASIVETLGTFNVILFFSVAVLTIVVINCLVH